MNVGWISALSLLFLVLLLAVVMRWPAKRPGDPLPLAMREDGGIIKTAKPLEAHPQDLPPEVEGGMGTPGAAAGQALLFPTASQRPPDDDTPPLPARIAGPGVRDAQIIGWVAQCAELDQESAVRRGLLMLKADDAWLRAAGAVLLCARGAVTDEVLALLGKDDEPFVTLTVLGWLTDAGRLQETERLLAAWRANGAGEAAAVTRVADSLRGGAFGDISGRAALRWLRVAASADAFREVLAAVVDGSGSNSYSVRMAALLTERFLMDPGEFQRRLQLLHKGSADSGVLSDEALRQQRPSSREGVAGATEPLTARTGAGVQERVPADRGDVWEQGVARMRARMSGPPELAATIPAMSPAQVELFFARPHAVLLEEAALWIEAVTDGGTVPVARDSAAMLASHVDVLAGSGSLVDTENYAVVRIRSRLGQLAAMEKELPYDGPP